MHQYRTHNCNELRADNIDNTVRLSGWVHRKRDHGGLLFIDLRDHFGLTQLVFDPDSDAFLDAEKVRNESVVTVNGKVVKRSDDTFNKGLPTGEIEVYVDSLEVLSSSDDLPLPVFGEPDYPEELRLKYRFLDLRRETLHKNIILRSDIINFIRQKMIENDFLEIQTPIMTASSPEGARDYLVPSRVHQGKFYALPQAPQQFKQLLMTSGFDRYFQIAPCFRDEDARADRSPGEFYQLDIEMSFVNQEDVFNTVEPILRDIFEKFSKNMKVNKSFPRITFADSIKKYGTDKPDLRVLIELKDITKIFVDSGFKIFSEQIAKDNNIKVWAIPSKTGGSRAFCDKMNKWAIDEGQPGLGYIFFKDGKGSGPIAKNIGEEKTSAIREELDLEDGDAVFFVCGIPDNFLEFISRARVKIGNELNLIKKDCFEFCWIVDFPMFEYNQDEKKIDFSHNPFSMPQGGLKTLENSDPLEINAYQYDIVCNGVELSSGAIRNHRQDILIKAFQIAGYDIEEIKSRFGAMFEAFAYGAPPHGGIAPGIDRMVMLLAGVNNLREVIAFPMNQQAQDLLMNAPSEITSEQAKELGIKILEKKD
ncbi:MAG: aspartate--tRNA ligase [Pseudomonadota bacterium]|nr:aspartate--tRNA ligase [Pseudomonadota bacterium]MEC7830628.1 aspartate--tRNA ligase [Pseudomonadota bacterium]MEC9382596.1 aspartate--tRNA ligase [Pseudomonadota bacterium]MEC9414328.1 aspartate--tRNA ligase [Pseudomonadota bacterium]MEC9481352.1 aspartate--tRNA ligase [Pseudomonadota bacterium]